MFKTQRQIFGLNLSQKGSVNIRPNVNPYEDLGILRITVADRTIIWVTNISLILLYLTYIF